MENRVVSGVLLCYWRESRDPGTRIRLRRSLPQTDELGLWGYFSGQQKMVERKKCNEIAVDSDS